VARVQSARDIGPRRKKAPPVRRARNRIAPQFEDLAACLNGRDGRFLGVSVGVGRLSIAIARRWPSLTVVGIDTWAPSLALARNNVAVTGLQDRIELRGQAGEELSDEKAFDRA
jgi:methylase of polypeptide subunit release factors